NNDGANLDREVFYGAHRALQKADVVEDFGNDDPAGSSRMKSNGQRKYLVIDLSSYAPYDLRSDGRHQVVVTVGKNTSHGEKHYYAGGQDEKIFSLFQD